LILNCGKVTMITIEQVDDTTNIIMDQIRKEFNLSEDCDKDDRIYSYIHQEILYLIGEGKVIGDEM
jgi:hypothetical protein